MESNGTKQDCTIVSQKLTQISISQSERSIYKVHTNLRNVNPEAYEPGIVAIGPYHRDKDDLKMMEDHKRRYLHLLLQRNNENVDKYVSAVARLESKARECYAEPISLSATEFIEMLVLDGCFIIELVRKYKMRSSTEENDPIFQMGWIIRGLKKDLMLFENQIPFFILCKLFDLIESPYPHCSLADLLLSFFSSFFNALCPGNALGEYSTDVIGLHEIRHLLDLMYRGCLLPQSDDKMKKGETGWELCINNATKLKEANVEFKKNVEKVNLLDIVLFENEIISMAPLPIEDDTESFFRNLIAYEQYFQKDFPISFVTDYVLFLDSLIDSSKDVEILSGHGIIENLLGDDEVVAKMVNKLTDQVIGRPDNHFFYAGISKDLNKHCKKRRKKWMASLWRNHLNSPWAIISIVAAVVLLLLSITQTVFTILQVV